MKIAIASGKGGTGKTTVATNLAYVASNNGETVAYLDCDVEEPNGHIFLKPEITETRPVGNLIPQVDAKICTHCGKCGEICQFSAIVCVGEKVLTFPQLCHGCGGCTLVCPVGAISEVTRQTGVVKIGLAAAGRDGAIRFVQGELNVGEAMSPPVIRAVKAAAPHADVVIVDSPPGTSCPVIESVRGSDYVVLVTEPTPFGLHDLKLAVAMLRKLELPFGVVINRADLAETDARSYCKIQGIEVIAEIPDDRRIAEAYSRGEIACQALPAFEAMFLAMAARIKTAAG